MQISLKSNSGTFLCELELEEDELESDDPLLYFRLLRRKSGLSAPGLSSVAEDIYFNTSSIPARRFVLETSIVPNSLTTNISTR